MLSWQGAKDQDANAKGKDYKYKSVSLISTFFFCVIILAITSPHFVA